MKKNIFKKDYIHKSLVFLILLTFCLSLTSPIFALEIGDKLKNFGEAAGYGKEAKEPRFLIADIIKVVLSFIGVVFIVLMLYAGYRWMTAAGEEEKIERAKQIIRAALWGVIVVLIAYSFVYFILEKIILATVGGGGGAGMGGS